MKRFCTLLLLLCVQILTVQAQGFTGNLMFTANMDGLQEAPPVITPAIGVAGLTLNATHDTLCVNVSVFGLSGPITSAHIHFGPPAVAGPVLIGLNAFVSGNRIITTIASPADSIIRMLMDGMLYINVHTALNPNGEIRGQIFLESDVPLGAILDGAQETPPVVTPGYGFASFKLSKSREEMSIYASFGGLTDSITGIHLHTGAVGVGGPVVENLMPGLTGNTLDIDVDPTAYLTDLVTGNIYINVHTATNPNGEIRGQVLLNPKLAFFFTMSGAQETPPNSSPGSGNGLVWMSNSMDTLFYYLAVDSLTSAYSASHLHLGAPGVAGSVLVPLSGNGKIFFGAVTDSTINLNLVRQMLEGNVYANIHTTNFPAGELRGQLERFAREGFSYEINGGNEVPPVATNATGFGVASLDGELESLYYSLVVSELSSAVLSGHFHQNVAGQNGPIIFTISTLNGAFNGAEAKGYWTSGDTITPFTPAYASALFADSVYFNIHTNAFPGGEARGQLSKGGLCFGIPVFINEINSGQLSVNAYPNPVVETLHLEVNASNPGKSTIRIYDLAGRLLASKSANLKTGINQYEIDVRNFEDGTYLIQVGVNEHEVFGKFVKE